MDSRLDNGAYVEISLQLGIDAILNVCQGDRRIFAPSNVRKMIQRLDRDAGLKDAALTSAKLQPHLRTLRRCRCIEFMPTTQARNRPYKIVDRDRLQALRANPELVIRLLSDDADVGIVSQDEGAAVEAAVSLDEDTNARTLLESLDEHSNDLRESLEAELGKMADCVTALEARLVDRIANLQQRIEFIDANTEQLLARIEGKLSSLCSLYAPEALSRVSGKGCA